MVARIRSIPLLLLAAIMLLATPRLDSRAEAAPPALPKNRAKLLVVAKNAPQVSVLHDSSTGIVLDVSIPNYHLEPVQYDGIQYDAVRVDGGSLTSQAGAPQLPVLGYLIGVPKDASLDLKVELVQVDMVPGDFRLPPAPRMDLSEVEGQPGTLGYVEDPQVYTSPAVYPSQPVRLGEDAWLRDQRLARLEIYPFQITPESGSLVWNRHLRVAVSFQSGSPSSLECLLCLPLASQDPDPRKQGKKGFREESNPFESALRGALINYESARRWRELPDIKAPALTLDPGETYYRIPIERDGLYRLTYENLAAAGLDVASLDPTLLHLTSQGQDVAMHLHNTDGDINHFSAGEYLAFYGQKLYGDHLAELYSGEDSQWLTFRTQDISGTYITWTPEYNAAQVQKYTDQNVYWLSLETSPGSSMQDISGFPSGAPLALTYRETQREERSMVRVANQSWNLVSGEENWYWTENTTSDPAGTTWVYTTSLSAVASGNYSATVRGELISINNNDGSSPDHHTVFYLNDASHLQSLDDKTWDGKSRYGFERSLDQSDLLDGENRLDLVAYKTAEMYSDTLYFDWFEIEYEREYQARENEITFSPSQPGEWRYQIGGFTSSDLCILNITDPLSPTWVTGALWNAGSIDFQLTADIGATLYAGKMISISPEEIQPYTPADLTTPDDYLIITHADFITSAQRLADYRQAQGLSSRVIDVAELYNQFNFGIFNPIAIKNYLRYTFEAWDDEPPSYILLVGDGHWNFKGSPRYNSPPIYMPPNLAWIDPWYGELDSTNQLAAVVGDDPLPDVSLSRMPVNSPADLDAIIDKTIAYESAPRQDWQRRFTFIADNVPDSAGDFVGINNKLIEDYSVPGISFEKIYENDFSCPFGNKCPAVTAAITQALNITGTLLLNYTGHGSINRWSGETIFSNDDITSLTNGERLPVVLSMTCNDGFWSHPGITPNPLESLMEEMLRAPGKGMVASFSPTGFGVSTGHDLLHRGFYDALLHNGTWELSQAVASARLRLYATGSNEDLLHTFTIFGDPALHIPSPFSLELNPTVQESSGPPGKDVDYPFTLINTGAITDTFSFEVESTGWVVTLPASLTLPAAGSAPLTLTVTIPENASDGDHDTATIHATSQGDIAQLVSFQLTTTAYDYGVLLTAAPDHQVGSPGELVTYTVQVYNNGAYEDLYDLSLSPGVWEVSPIPRSIGPLSPGESLPLTVQVQIPEGEPPGSIDSVTLFAASREKPARTDSATLVTSIQEHRLYLPQIEK